MKNRHQISLKSCKNSAVSSLQDVHRAGHEPNDVILVPLQIFGKSDQKIGIGLLGQLGVSRHVLSELAHSDEVGHVFHEYAFIGFLVLAVVVDLQSAVRIQPQKFWLPFVIEKAALKDKTAFVQEACRYKQLQNKTYSCQ